MTEPVGKAPAQVSGSTAGSTPAGAVLRFQLDPLATLVSISQDGNPPLNLKGWRTGASLTEWLENPAEREVLANAIHSPRLPVRLPVTLTRSRGDSARANLTLESLHLETRKAGGDRYWVSGAVEIPAAFNNHANESPVSPIIVEGDQEEGNNRGRLINNNLGSDLPVNLRPNHKPYRASFWWLMLPLTVLLLLTLAVSVERMGLSYNVSSTQLNFIDKPAVAAVEPAPAACLILYDSHGPGERQPLAELSYVLKSMKVNCDSQDVHHNPVLALRPYQQLIVAFPDINQIEPGMATLDNWIRSGGEVLFAIRPDPGIVFQSIYRRLGIQSRSGDLIRLNGFEAKPGFLFAVTNAPIGNEFLIHSSIPVVLDPAATVHATSGDEYKVPLVWSYKSGLGRVVVINSDQFLNRVSAGVNASAYSLLFDTFAWPVVNSAVVFLEDFPGPLPSGTNANIQKQYGRDIRSFFVNIWWPDMVALAQRHGLKYTGLMVESYSNNTQPPFLPEGDADVFQYLGASLLDGGGELATQGFNKVPLCLTQELPEISNEPSWPTSDDMQFGVDEGFRFVLSLFPQQPAVTLAPPAGVLCADANRWLPESVPSLRVLSGKYLPGTALNTPAMDFAELPTGLISFPRISSGYMTDDYERWANANALTLLYVSSHSVNANTVLGNSELANKGWESMRNQLENTFLTIDSEAEGLRQMTAREGAMATQRYSRLGVAQKADRNGLHLSLSNFEDEAWFIVRSAHLFGPAEGARLINLNDGLWLVQATQAEVTLPFEAAQ